MDNHINGNIVIKMNQGWFIIIFPYQTAMYCTIYLDSEADLEVS